MAEVNLDDAPRKARELFDKGFAALERNNLQYAADMFSAALELEPRLLRARRFLRATQMKQFKAKNGGSITHILSSLTGFPGMMAVQSALKKDPAKALKAAEKLLKSDPLNLTFIHLQADSALAADMPEVAIQTLEIAREHYPKDVKLLKRLGSLYLDQNETHKGRECFEVLLTLNPGDQEIVKLYKDASALDTMQSGGWNEAGSYRDVMKDTKEATRLEQESKAVKTSSDVTALIEDSLRKIEQEPGNINYRRGLADLYVRANQLDKALETLQQAHELSGGADPQIDRALSNVRLRQFDEEIKRLREAGDEPAAQAKETEKDAFALTDAEDRVKRYPNDLQFRYELGVQYYEHDRLTDAIQQFQQAQRNPQRRTRSLYYMALCFKAKKQFDIASEQLEKALSELHTMDDTKKDILYELGDLHEAMQHSEQALKYYKEIYSVDIGFRDVAEKIEKGANSGS